MFYKSIITYTFLFFILLNEKNAHSQLINFKTDCYWIDIGAGIVNTFKYSGGLHADIGINFVKNKNIYKAEYQYNEEFELFPKKLPVEYLHSINFLIGKQLSLDNFTYLQFAAGLGVIWGTIRGNTVIEERKGGFSSIRYYYNTKRPISPSIPIETELVFKPIKYAQIGVSLFGNINIKRPFYGFAVKAGIGKVR